MAVWQPRILSTLPVRVKRGIMDRVTIEDTIRVASRVTIEDAIRVVNLIVVTKPDH